MLSGLIYGYSEACWALWIEHFVLVIYPAVASDRRGENAVLSINHTLLDFGFALEDARQLPPAVPYEVPADTYCPDQRIARKPPNVVLYFFPPL